MRLAYVHAYDGVTGTLLLGACLDAGVPWTAVRDGWQALQLPEMPITAQRLPGADEAMLTQVTFAEPVPVAALAALSYATLLARITHSQLGSRVQQRLLHLLSHYTAAVARVHGVADGTALVLQAASFPAVLYLGIGVIVALEALGIDQVMASPLLLDTGMPGPVAGPIPQPLTIELCRGVPVYGRSSSALASTVDGVAIVTGLARRFGPLPGSTITGTGYGSVPMVTGVPTRRLQLVLAEATAGAGEADAERIAVLEANIDDMNPEFYEAIFERLFAQGALDVTLTPLFMKKNRPANTLTVLAPLSAVMTLSRAMLQETSTFGVRIYEVWRQKLDRFHRQVDTCYGMIPVKCGVLEGRIVQAAPEYDACKRAAREQGVPVRLVYAEAARASASWLRDQVTSG